jgi:hypothetical protein
MTPRTVRGVDIKREGLRGTKRDQEKFVAGVDGSKMRRGILPPNEAFVMG